jgi:hypothetical protein
VLAQGFDVGDHVTILVDVISAGIVGTDGSPVPTTDINGNPIQYFFPGIDIPGQYYTVTDGNTFFVIADGEVVETSQPAFFPLPVGTHFPLMYTFDYITGRVEQDLALWLQDGNGRWFPFLNEGLMMTNVRRVH